MAELIINGNDRKAFIDIKQETISGFVFKLAILGGFTKADVHLLDGHIVTLSRYLDGQKLEDVLILSIYQLYAIAYAGNSDFADNSLFSAVPYLNEEYLLKFSLGTNYVLKNGEYFRLECTNASFGGDPISYSVTTVPSIGVQTFKPAFEIYNLDSQKTKYDLNLGNDVQRVVFLQRELPNAVTPLLRTPIRKMQVKADKIDAEFSKEQIYLGNLSTDGNIEAIGTPINLLQTPTLLNNLKMTLECVNASANRQLIVCRAVQTPEIVNNFQRKNAEHYKENMAHVKNNDALTV